LFPNAAGSLDQGDMGEKKEKGEKKKRGVKEDLSERYG
jgi:hypothetical protein